MSSRLRTFTFLLSSFPFFVPILIGLWLLPSRGVLEPTDPVDHYWSSPVVGILCFPAILLNGICVFPRSPWLLLFAITAVWRFYGLVLLCLDVR